MQAKVQHWHDMVHSPGAQMVNGAYIEHGLLGDYSKNKLRADLIVEEADETYAAICSGNLAETIDGLCDLLYVIFGAADKFGIDLEPFFNEVYRSNMTKVGAPRREDGKIMKGPFYEPPQIKELLKTLYGIDG